MSSNLDPIFADDPRRPVSFPEMMADAICAPLACISAAPGYYEPISAIDEDIAGHEGDIEVLEEQIAYNQQLIPKLERETLEKQLELTTHKLHICELKAKKAARIGGQLR